MHAERQLASAKVSWLIPVLMLCASAQNKGLSLLIHIRKLESLRLLKESLSEILREAILIEIDKCLIQQNSIARFTLSDTKKEIVSELAMIYTELS